MANSNWVHADNVAKLRPEAEKFYNYCVDNFSNFEAVDLPAAMLLHIKWDYSTHHVLARFLDYRPRFSSPNIFTASTFMELRDQLRLRGLPVPEYQEDVVKHDNT